MPEETDQETVQSEVEAALAGKRAILWLTDKKGRVIGVPAEKLAYVEIGNSSDGPSIGFGS